MSDITDLIRTRSAEYTTAVAAMKDAAKEMAQNGLSEARQKELADAFKRAESETSKLDEQLKALIASENAQRTAAEQYFQREEQSGKKPSLNEPTDPKEKLELERRRHMDIFRRGMQYGGASLTEDDRKIFMRGTSTQVVGTGSLGGNLVPTLLQDEIIGLMKDYSGILQVATIRPTAKGGQILFPKRDFTARKAVKTAESGTIAVQDIAWTQVAMDAYKYSDALKVSSELMQDAEYDIMTEFRTAFSESFGRAANETLTVGDGSGDPNGVVVASALGVTAASATAIVLDDLIKLEHAVDPAYRRSAGCGYMLHDQILLRIKLLSLAASNEGAGTWQASFRDGTPATINGYPYWINQDMDSALTASKKVALFGDFKKYVVRQVRDMTIQRNDFIFMATDEVGFFATARWDGELFDPTAVKHLITAAS